MGLLTLSLFLFLLYVLIETLIPGDIVTPLRLGMTGQELEELRQQMGLDRALPIRFWRWLEAVIRGDLATAGFRGRGETIFAALPGTLIVFVVGLALSYSAGTWLGRRSAWEGGTIAGTLTLLGVVAYTLFPPFLAFILDRWLFDDIARIKEAVGVDSSLLWGEGSPTEGQVMVWSVAALALAIAVVSLIQRSLKDQTLRHWFTLKVTAVTGLTVIFWQILGINKEALDVLTDATVPILAFALLSIGEFMLITQAGMAESLHEDFVLTARAKGLPEVWIRDRHVGRGAMLIAFTRLAVSLPYLLTGLVIIETAVRWPGVGTFMFNAIETQDMPVVMSGLAVIGVMTMVMRLVLEVVIAGADPRVLIRGEA